MKKNIRTLAGIALASMMTLATATTGFAFDNPTFTGTITEESLAVSVTLPASGDLTITPFASPQIATAYATTISNTGNDTKLDVSVAGYNVVATSKSTDNPISLSSTEKATGDYSGTKKEVYMAIQITNPETKTTATAVKDKATWDSAFSAGTAIDVPVAKLSTKDYVAGDATTYTSVTGGDAVTLAATIKTGGTGAGTETNYANFRITGTMNPNATWEVGDKIVVTPVFKVAPNVE
jgi:hypothetical protein